MDKKELKAKLENCIKLRKNEIIDIGGRIYNKPETGFKEFITSRFVAEKFRGMGLECIELEGIPGVKASIDTGREGPGIAILSELDSIICPEHPDSDKTSGAVHACGHNIQVAAMLGAAMGILDSGTAAHLCGKIHFIAVPAEEYIQLEYRMELREKGVIRYLGGKPEMLYRGWFDDVDLCFMVHAFPLTNKKVIIAESSNGCIIKKVRYIGKATHAGGTPQEGINALYAANIGLMAINSIRETFVEEEFIRIHPIITKGGEIVNVIPSDVRLETFIRGKTATCIAKANKKADRALAGGAVAIGAKVEIEDIPGYHPFINDSNFISMITQKVLPDLMNAEEIAYYGHDTGSSDIGDLSAVMPAAQIGIGGVKGGLHTPDFAISDYDMSYIFGARLLAVIAVELLTNGGKEAENIITRYKPVFSSRQKYFKFTDSILAKKLHDGNELFK